jgi:hypothetical protein
VESPSKTPPSPGGAEEKVTQLPEPPYLRNLQYDGSRASDEHCASLGFYGLGVTFQEELVPFLRKKGIGYDEIYIWS